MAQEAAELYRALAEQHLDAFTPQLVVVLLEQEQFDEAEARGLDGKASLPVVAALAETFQRLEQWQKAIHWFERIADISPDSKEEAEARIGDCREKLKGAE